MTVIIGRLTNVKPINDWAVGYIQPQEGLEMRVTGSALKDLSAGCSYEFSGTKRVHPKYGEALDVLTATPYVESDPHALARFIAANYKGIGLKSATKFVDGIMQSDGLPGLEQLRQQLTNEPWSVDFSSIKREGEFDSEQQGLRSAFVERELLTRIGSLSHIRGAAIKALAAWLSESVNGNGAPNSKTPSESAHLPARCWQALCDDPYKPISFVSGYGFVLADAIGRMVGVERTDPRRLSALTLHALKDGCEVGGHVYLTVEQMRKAIAQVDPSILNQDLAIEHALKSGSVLLDDQADRLYVPTLLRCERRLAARVARLCAPAKGLMSATPDLRQKIQSAAKSLSASFANGLDDSQLGALGNLLTSRCRLHTLTAGPGCGKTALMEVLVRILPGKQFHFCAPTGKAAKVLSNRLSRHGHFAQTVHSLLQGGDGGFRLNEQNPLDGDVLVVDEGSMPDAALFNALLAAVPPGMHVIVLGDPNQLPSIGPGRVLADLLELPEIDHNRLDVTHRNTGGILDVVSQIRTGQLRTHDRETVKFSHGLGDAQDDFQMVQAAYVNAVAQRRVENVMLMMSRRKGEPDKPGWNTTYANEVLRKLMNPGGEKIPGCMVNVRDRVIIRSNMEIALHVPEPTWQESMAQAKGKKSEKKEPQMTRVVNGDTGTVKGYLRDKADTNNHGAKSVVIELDDGRCVDFPGAATNALDLAYALTVHAAQGSEYAHVIKVATGGQPTFINRNMLYTAASRARDRLEVFGEDATIQRIAQTPLPHRNSALVERVRGILDSDEQEESEPDWAPSVQLRV